MNKNESNEEIKFLLNNVINNEMNNSNKNI